MKVCIIGATGHVAYVVQGVAEDKDAVIAGISPGSQGESVDRLLEACEHHGVDAPPLYEDYRAMLDEVRPDVVGIGPEYADNARIAIEALQRDISVFIEKPVATTLEDLTAVERAYEGTKAELAAMMALRYEPAFTAAWQAVRDGAIGDVRLATAQKSYKCGPRPEFFKDRVRYGGTIPWVGSHGIDLLQWFAGVPFRSVYATHTTRANGDNGDMEVSALCHFTFEDDIYGGCNIDYLRPQAAETHGDDRVRVAGTEGVIEVRGGQAYLINAAADGTQELEPAPERQIFVDVLERLRGNTPCRITAAESFSMTRACLLARESADRGEIMMF